MSDVCIHINSRTGNYKKKFMVQLDAQRLAVLEDERRLDEYIDGGATW